MWTDRAAALVRLNVTLYAREPGPLIGRVVMPLVLITLMRPLYSAAFGTSAGTAQAVAGMLVAFSLLGMSIVGGAILVERSWRTADRLRASPAGGAELLAGKAAPTLALLVVQQVVILGYGRIAFGLRLTSPLLLAATVLVWAAALLCIGAMLGTTARSASGLAAMVDIGSLVLTGFGGAFVPLSLLPGWARAVSPLSPGYWAMHALRGALDGDVRAAAAGWLALVLFATIAAGIAAARLRRGWGRAVPA
jgi:ABC-2 type transport system permease protein